MADSTTSIYRGGEEKATEEKLPEGTTPDFQASVEVEEPFTAYKGNRPEMLLVDYFELGDKWNDAMSGFPRELEVINDYLVSKVRSGELADDQKVIKGKIEAMVKTNNLTKEPRNSVRLPVLASYCRFMAETDGTRFTAGKI